MFGAIEGALKKKEEVRLVGFGTFATAKRKAGNRAAIRAPARRSKIPASDLGPLQARQGAEGRGQLESRQIGRTSRPISMGG